MQARVGNSEPFTEGPEMFSYDQWRPSGKNGEGCFASARNKLSGLEESSGGACQAVQAARRGDGEVEG